MSVSPPQISEQCPECSATLSAFFTFCPSCGCKLSRPIREPIGSSAASITNGISIQRNGQVFGPYPREVIQQWIARGQVYKHDLGCRDLVEGWQPLGKLLWPEQFSKAGTLSGKQWAWIVAAVVGFIALGTLTSSLNNNNNSGSVSTLQSTQSQKPVPQTDFERGEQYLENGSYLAASSAFESVQKTDPKYADAQVKLRIIKQKIAEQNARESKKDAVRKQYERLFHGGLYAYEIEQRLQREGFHLDDSKFEAAPDGSHGVRRYFSKTTGDGLVVKIWIQNAYAMGYYYHDLQVQ